MEFLRDLLSPSKKNLSIRIGNTGALEIPGLLAYDVNSVEEVEQVLAKGKDNRVCFRVLNSS